MSKISKIDSNFKLNTAMDKKGIKWYSADSEVFSIFGLIRDENGYKRMDSNVAKNTSEGVYELHRMTSGGRIVFETDSPYVAINVKYELLPMGHMTLTGSSGFDLYIEKDGEFRYLRSFVPPVTGTDGYENIVEFPVCGSKKILIHFPLYNNVDELYIGLDENASVNKICPYKDKKPIVFYGSSITQGGCASRPGNNYCSMVSLKMKTDFLCLGFSGSAHGEQEMAEYIANLPMSVFVMDYDYNDVKTPELLRERHYPFYKTVRDKNPDIPIIIMSAPLTEYEQHIESRLVVIDTYNKAKADGDNVYFIDGSQLFAGEFGDCATVDGCHPNDYGFYLMAEAVINVMKTEKL